MTTYLIRLYNQKDQLTLEESVQAECLGGAMKEAEALKNDVNAKEGYSAGFVLKAVTIKEQ